MMEMCSSMKKDIIRYSLQIAMLTQLLNKRLITKQEFTIIKNKLMEKYRVVSDLTS